MVFLSLLARLRSGSEGARTQRALTRGTAKRLSRKRAKPRPIGRALGRFLERLGELAVFWLARRRSYAKLLLVYLHTRSSGTFGLEPKRPVSASCIFPPFGMVGMVGLTHGRSGFTFELVFKSLRMVEHSGSGSGTFLQRGSPTPTSLVSVARIVHNHGPRFAAQMEFQLACILEKHGGALQYRTEVDRGTTFGIVLPRVEKDKDEVPDFTH